MRESDISRFWSYVDKTPGQGPQGECWEWQGSRVPDGYGQFWLNGSMVGAHRAALLVTLGSLTEGLEVLHSCDNRPCCNPAHLSEGTHQDNLGDAATKGRMAGTRGRTGEKSTMGKLTDEQADEARRLYATGDYTQASLAERFGVHQTNIGKVVRGEAYNR